MRWCLRCLTEHLDSASDCRDCGSTLVDAATATRVRAERESRHRWGESMVVAEWLSSAAEAEHLRAMLRRLGIDATVVPSRPLVLGTLVDPASTRFGVVVFEGDRSQARRAWSDWQSASPAQG